jgi:DNA-binding protein YbaB
LSESQGDARPDGSRPGQILGSAAGGLVTVAVSPMGQLLAVDIRPGAYQPHDPPGLENMGDMLVEAFTDAITRARAAAAEPAVQNSGLP